MATGIRLTPNVAGCPPTATPPSEYQSPFYEDSSGALWVKQCFPGFIYFGAARHDIPFPVVPGSDNCKIDTSNSFESGTAVTAGTYTTRTITNTTDCTLGFLLAHNVITEMTTNYKNWVAMSLVERWNGAYHSQATVTSEWKPSSSKFVQTYLHQGASPHDVNRDSGGGASLTLAPGESANVNARLMVRYFTGSPVPGETIWASSSAVRIYGYVLG